MWAISLVLAVRPSVQLCLIIISGLQNRTVLFCPCVKSLLFGRVLVSRETSQCLPCTGPMLNLKGSFFKKMQLLVKRQYREVISVRINVQFPRWPHLVLLINSALKCFKSSFNVKKNKDIKNL